MPLSFGRKSKIPERNNQTIPSVEPGVGSRLVDLRDPEAFAGGFIPGSYNIPDLACVNAAQRTGLFRGRKIYLIAEDEKQLQLCPEAGDLGKGSQISGWFGPEAIDEWQRTNANLGSIDAISSDTLCIRMAAWSTLLLDIYENDEERTPSYNGALRFCLENLLLSMEGLPTESSLCLTARTSGLASFAASLLWNFGFHKVSYLSSGCRLHFPLAG